MPLKTGTICNGYNFIISIRIPHDTLFRHIGLRLNCIVLLRKFIKNKHMWITSLTPNRITPIIVFAMFRRTIEQTFIITDKLPLAYKKLIPLPIQRGKFRSKNITRLLINKTTRVDNIIGNKSRIFSYNNRILTSWCHGSYRPEIIL